MKNKFENLILDEERALYAAQDAEIVNCRFEGPADGESALKECRRVQVENCDFLLRYPFWHGKNITVYDSVVKGEYLAWYSENLRLVHCKIIGTQPFCYAKNLILEDCEMVDCDLSFENTTVQATVKGEITSVKNPAGGSITADRIGEIILDEYQWKLAPCTITELEKK